MCKLSFLLKALEKCCYGAEKRETCSLGFLWAWDMRCLWRTVLKKSIVHFFCNIRAWEFPIQVFIYDSRDTCMGIATGGDGGDVSPPVQNSRRDVPPEFTIFKEKFLNICQNFKIFQYFQNKVGEIQVEIRIWG